MLHRVDLSADLVEWVEDRDRREGRAQPQELRRRFARDLVRRRRAGRRAPGAGGPGGEWRGRVLGLGAVARARGRGVPGAPRHRPCAFLVSARATDDGQALLIERVAGTADLARLSHDERATALFEFVDALAELHAVDVDTALARSLHPARRCRRPRARRPRPVDRPARDVGGPGRSGDRLRAGVAPARTRPRRSRGRCWSRATPGPATSSPPTVTSPGWSTGSSRTSATPWTTWHGWSTGSDGSPTRPAFDAFVAHYESRTGSAVDRDAIAYYAVLVQVRSAITTARTIARGGGAVGLAGYLVAHQRFLQGITETLAARMGVGIEPVTPVAAPPTPESEMYDRAIDDLEHWRASAAGRSGGEAPGPQCASSTYDTSVPSIASARSSSQTDAPIDFAGAGERGDQRRARPARPPRRPERRWLWPDA